MKSVVFSVITLFAIGSVDGARHNPRQNPSSSAAPSTTGSGAPPLSFPSTLVPVSSVSLTFSLLSTNPTAVPLSYIASGVSTQPTSAISTTYAAGSKPTSLPNAPPLPDGIIIFVALFRRNLMPTISQQRWHSRRQTIPHLM